MNDKSKKFKANPGGSMPDPNERQLSIEQRFGFDAFRRLNRSSVELDVQVEAEGSALNNPRLKYRLVGRT